MYSIVKLDSYLCTYVTLMRDLILFLPVSLASGPGADPGFFKRGAPS